MTTSTSSDLLSQIIPGKIENFKKIANAILIHDTQFLRTLALEPYKIPCSNKKAYFNLFHIAALANNRDAFHLLREKCVTTTDYEAPDRKWHMKPMDYAFMMQSDALYKENGGVLYHGHGHGNDSMVDELLCHNTYGLLSFSLKSIMSNIVRAYSGAQLVKNLPSASLKPFIHFFLLNSVFDHATNCAKDLYSQVLDISGYCHDYQARHKSNHLATLKDFMHYIEQHANAYLSMTSCNEDERSHQLLHAPLYYEPESQALYLFLCEKESTTEHLY